MIYFDLIQRLKSKLNPEITCHSTFRLSLSLVIPNPYDFLSSIECKRWCRMSELLFYISLKYLVHLYVQTWDARLKHKDL